jgi:hypothetical protein
MNHRKNRRRSRSGFSLLHQIAIISVLPLLFLAVSSWVHESLKMSTQFKHRRESHVAMVDLSNQIRNDVRNSKLLEFNSDLNRVELTGHNAGVVVFQIEGKQITKTATVDGEVVGRDSFRLSKEYFVEWGSSTGPDGVALNVFRHSSPLYGAAVAGSLKQPKPKLEFVITAKTNRWQRSIVFGRESKNGGDE